MKGVNVHTAAAIHNAVSIVCWTFLAVFFRHWWIALFGFLFLASTGCEKECCGEMEDNLK